MFFPILLFELRYRLRQPATWIYFGLLFLMSGLLVTAAGGGFGSGAKVSIGGDGQAVKINAPYAVGVVLAILSTLGVIIASSLMASPVYRDFEYHSHALFYTKPITKAGYLGGRFVGSYLVAALAFSGLVLGAGLAGVMPWVETDRFLAHTPVGTYLWPFALIILPNLLFTGAIFFTTATLTRNMLSTYIGSIVLVVGYFTANSYLTELKNNDYLVAALDAFGLGAFRLTTRYWTAADKNHLLLPLNAFMVLNRAVWLGVALAILAFGYARFRFSAFASDKAPKKSKRVAAALADDDATQPAAGTLRLPRVAQLFTTGVHLGQFWSLTRLEFRGIVRSVAFAAIVGIGVIFLLATAPQIGKTFDTTTYPVTGDVVSVMSGTFAAFLLILITFYSGELVWREREAGVAQIADAVPAPSWVPLASKLAALVLVQAVLLLVPLACGLLVQLWRGYYHFEIGLYLTALYGLQLPYLALLCVLAVVLQVLVNNKYLGFAAMVVYYVGDLFRPQLGLTHRLLDYAGSAGLPHSDMNGYGHFMPTFWYTKLYWLGWAVLLLVLANLLWVRGTDSRNRWVEARRRWNSSNTLAAALGALVTVGAGAFIFYNTNVLNRYLTPKAQEKLQAQYERQFRRYKDVAQPRIVAVDLKTDIYPRERAVHFEGTFMLVNKRARALDTVIVSLPVEQHPRLRRLALGAPGAATLALADTALGFRLYRLARPLAPGDSLPLTMSLTYREVGFPNDNSNTDIVYNGSFVSSNYLPSLGYRDEAELGDDQTRKEYGFKPKPRMAAVNDLKARQNTYVSQDADWIRFRTTVSTEADQTAIAPGYLQREWTQGGRRYFTYVMDQPMLNFYTFLSARYRQYKDQWVDSVGHRTIPITIYYQPGHTYDLANMAAGAKASLSYCSRNFSPYQHRQVRILEFPNYQSFAQSFANTIPYSESIGFIVKVDPDDPEDLNIPFYVTAHEVAHQWWAHQVIGGNVQGSTLMVEAMAEYSALMVVKHRYGYFAMEKFLRLDQRRYLTGRAFEQKKEVPLALVENQSYIHYGKGSVVMYALQDYLGEQKLNAALHDYVHTVAFQGPPYTNSTEFIGYLRQAAPDSLQQLLTDNFDRITLYENRVTDATAKKLPDGRYQVDFTVRSHKFYADSTGTQRPAAERDYLPVAVFPEKSKDDKPMPPLMLEKRRLLAGDNKLRFVVRQKPASVAVDPYHELIDRDLDDNSKDVKL